MAAPGDGLQHINAVTDGSSSSFQGVDAQVVSFHLSPVCYVFCECSDWSVLNVLSNTMAVITPLCFIVGAASWFQQWLLALLTQALVRLSGSPTCI